MAAITATSRSSRGPLAAIRRRHCSRGLRGRSPKSQRYQNENSFCVYSATIPIQNMVLSPTSISYLRTKVSLPSSAMRNTERPAATVLIASPSPHIHRQVVLRDQQAPARVDVEGARVYLLGLDMLDRRRLAGGLIDRIHHDAVFTAFEDLLTLKLGRGFSAICPVYKTAVGMYVDRACRLTRSNVVRLGQCLRAVCYLRVDPVALHPKHVHFVLRLDRHVHPGFGRMKI